MNPTTNAQEPTRQTSDFPRSVWIIVIATLLIFLPAIKIGFLNDDIANIRFVLSAADKNFFNIFAKPSLIGQYFRPLANASLVLDYSIWNWNPSGFRLTNLVLHLFATLLVYSLGRKLFPLQPTAFLGAAFFSVLPIHETSILWISGRGDLLCAVFYLASLVVFVDYLDGTRRTLTFSLLLYLLALLSKEMAFSLPLVVFLISWLKDRESRSERSWKKPLLHTVPYLILSTCYILLRWIALDNNVLFGDQGLHGNLQLMNIVKNLASYLGLLIVPAGHYEIEQLLSKYPVVFTVASLMSLIVLLYALGKQGRYSPSLTFAAIWILLTLLPVIRLRMRWYLYLPSVGFCWGLGWIFGGFSANYKRTVFLLISASLWMLYASISVINSLEWIGASKFGERLLAQIQEKAELSVEKDTLTFIDLPSRLKTTPVFHLGFPSTLRNFLGREHITVSTWSKVVVERASTCVSASLAPHGEGIIARTNSLAYFLLDDEQRILKNQIPTPGSRFSGEGAEITILGVDEFNKPNAILLAPNSPVTRNLFFFDGDQFVRLR